MSKAHEKDIRQQTRQTSFSSHIAIAYPSIEGGWSTCETPIANNSLQDSLSRRQWTAYTYNLY